MPCFRARSKARRAVITFSLPHAWVWDFWTADDGDLIHLFYLHAPKSLGDPELRHRNASIGHATSTDLMQWTDHGQVLQHGLPSDADATATWTGSVLRDPSGLWRMFYTGSRFLSAESGTNIETILMATSHDLTTWVKAPETELSADPQWFETLADETWHEEAWRDPWIVKGASDEDWHMLITARTKDLPTGLDPRDRGVIGHAVSSDLVHWKATAPLSEPGAGFAHLEVLQLAEIEGRSVLLFSCDSKHLAGARDGQAGGIWAVPISDVGVLWDLELQMAAAYRVTGDELYAGRVVGRADGTWALLGFENIGADGDFVGQLSDPVPLGWDSDGRLAVLPLALSAARAEAL